MKIKAIVAGLLILVILVLLAVWLALRGAPEPPPIETPAAPVRAEFEASQPLRLVLIATANHEGEKADLSWLDSELRYLLRRRGMRLEPRRAAASPAAQEDVFTLRAALSNDAQRASLALIAPDHVLERESTFDIEGAARLAIAQAFATQTPRFLGTPAAASDVNELLGTANANRYETFTRWSSVILGNTSRGYTRPPVDRNRARALERLERVTRSEPRFARARALLAAAYLSLGGEDEAALARLAETNAERAVALDPALPAAHAALGLVALRRNEWLAARDHFDAALSLDPDSAPALEGLACLLADAGRYRAAAPVAAHAVELQPQNVGANECLAYIEGGDAAVDDTPERTDGVADEQVLALKAVLSGDASKAESLLRDALRPQQFKAWAQPVLHAVGDPRRAPEALRAVTHAANDGRITAATEILCGVALRQSEFVFNRMKRLQRQRAHVPLRILWLPETSFLRQHASFEDVVSAANLTTFWQEHGPPDVCAAEPKIYGCNVRTE